MKLIKGLGLFLLIAATVFVACNKVNYKKAKSGLLYHIYPGKGKDSLIREGQFVKFEMVAKLEDSVLYSSYGKMPGYAKVMSGQGTAYSLLEILPLMRKGDSVVTIQLVDSLMKQNVQLPPAAKKGDRIMTTFRIIEVFTTDSLAMADYNREMERDRPRQLKEQEEEMAKMEKQRQEQQRLEDIELEKSGEIARELQDMEKYLKTKNITAQKTGKGTYVQILNPGTGEQAANGKYVNVKYTGSILATDSVFQSNTYEFQLGKGAVIRGWDEGLLLLKEGGKANLYIPGFLAYGNNPPPQSPFKPFDALKFEVELLNVSDTATVQGFR
jgi:FKBP-type peptidyl-prolyl cis-trans isomerase FkpA